VLLSFVFRQGRPEAGDARTRPATVDAARLSREIGFISFARDDRHELRLVLVSCA